LILADSINHKGALNVTLSHLVLSDVNSNPSVGNQELAFCDLLAIAGSRPAHREFKKWLRHVQLQLMDW
jgi:hypothetical protein